ncbi:RhoGAP-domain-containing protein [Hesseltinella vesiculosa]|uniref:RhoGAP-domain-containing protein n=1 Tax=Hesseltinella vesiculosa TaxID=101127 RepID=A0A1X2GBZ0_9FUNG|nr:RhoGAP-domain-containing protein [Hesseltinella vesiculosa]
MDCGFQCLSDKVKEDMQAAKDASLFLKKRAAIEEEYGKQMAKLAQSMSESFDKSHPRSGTYGDAWISMLKVHETIGEQRIKFSNSILEVAEDLQLLHKDTERGRKQVKDTGTRFEKALVDADANLEKLKLKYDSQNEDWERTVMQKNNDPLHVPKKGIFKNSKTPAQLSRLEEEARYKVTLADKNYRQQLQSTNASRQEYYQAHLPKILTDLKAIDDECCVALRYQLARYSYIYEEALAADGIALDNDDGLGLRSLTEKIDKDADFTLFINSYHGRNGKTSKSDSPYKDYNLVTVQTPVTNANPNPVFGVPLNTLLVRDQQEVPWILRKCAETVETYGLNVVGIYRLSGTNSQIQKLKGAFDRDCNAVNLNSEEYLSDINNITSVLKLWFRELPEPLFPSASYQQFLDAAQIEDDIKRVLGLHAVINDLPDAHYATLKYLMSHLDKIQQHQRYNKMGASNLATIFGMTLMGNEVAGAYSPTQQGSQRFNETQLQVKVVQTILENYALIFEADQ